MNECLDTGNDLDLVSISNDKSSRQVEAHCPELDVFVGSNCFIEEDFREVKCILTKLKQHAISNGAFIIYNFQSNELVLVLAINRMSPVLWAGSVSKSVSIPKATSLKEFVYCCLKPKEFHWAEHEIFLRIVI
jgi:hypothetical protein